MTSPRSPMGHWIFEEYKMSERGLGFSRILFAIYLFLFEYPRYQWMAAFPGAFYTPPLGFGIFFRQQPSGIVMWLLLAAIITLTISLLIGWKTRLSGIGLAVLIFAGNTFAYSFGKINHDILIIIVLAVMSFSGWERQFSLDRRFKRFEGEVSGWPLALLAMMIGLAMLSAALPKATSGWLDPSTVCVKGHIVYNFYATERPTWLAAVALQHTPFWIWKCLDWMTVAIEAAFVLAMFSKLAFRTVCALAVFFHAGIHFTMDIQFFGNVMAYAMFVPWDDLGIARIAGDGSARRPWLRAPVITAMVLLSGIALTIPFSRLDSPVARLLDAFGNGEWILHSLFFLTAAMSAAGYLCSLMLRLQRGYLRRRDPVAHPILLFDGVCGLCNGFVDFLLRHDRHGVIRFASLQSSVGQNLLRRHRLPPSYVKSIVFLSDGRAHHHSVAVLEAFFRLSAPWTFFYALMLIPPPLRDLTYDLIASHRDSWFGKRDACRIPSPAERAAFDVAL